MRAIQAVGLDLVEAHGYDGVTVEDIAAAAEVSPSSVYRYFETKEGIFLWDEGEAPLLDEVATDTSTMRPLEALKAAVHRLFDQRFDRDPSGMLRKLRLIYSVPVLEAAGRRQTDEFRHALGAILASAAGREIRDLRVQVAAAAAVGALTAAIEGWALANGRRPFREVVDEAFEVISNGLEP